MTPAPIPDHQSVVGNLHSILRNHIRPRRLGRLWGAPVDVRLSRFDVLEPDLAYLSNARMSVLRPKYLMGAPDLVVEVSSPSTARVDRWRKLDIYRRRGVREYWIVDLAAQAMEIHEFGSRPRMRRFDRSPTFVPRLFPGLMIDVAEVFEL